MSTVIPDSCMRSKLMLHRENEPFQYRLTAKSLEGNPPSLQIIVSKQSFFLIKDFGERQRRTRTPEFLEIEGGHAFETFTSFSDFPDLLGHRVFGFNNSHTVSENNDTVVLATSLPVIEKLDDEPCRFCEGTGRRHYSEDICFHCNGTKRKVEYDPADAIAISATHTLLFDLLRAVSPNIQLDIGTRQLLHLQLCTSIGAHGGSLGGVFSPELVGWLEEQGHRRHLPEVEYTVQAVWKYMHPISRATWDNDPVQFRTSIRDDGFLTIDCPGDACGIHPETFPPYEEDMGYRFDCHNVDSSVQQLTLLCALGKLSDMALEVGVGQ